MKIRAPVVLALFADLVVRAPAGGTSAQFADFVKREYEKWKVVVRESGATAE
jgi:hypothetical protein